ncbi:MAG: hypothetical protein H7X80_04075 [bacterium]|nr:hypothetical protein [Candidatus Kapabacteria bacterium]
MLFAFAVDPAIAQQSLTFDEFAKKIDPFFAPELVADVKTVLPQTAFDIWGYDIGDFTGDGANDLALTLRMRSDSRARINVYYFVDDEGTLRLVRETVEPFVELPIEVGVAIRDGNVYTIHKSKEFEWVVIGHRFRDGVLMMVDKFNTIRAGDVTHEMYRNFQSLEGFERYLSVTNEKQIFRSDFLSVPAYRRGRDVPSGYQATAIAHFSKYISRGTYFWNSEYDAGIDMRAAYDDDYLYFNIIVRDDMVIPIPVNNIDTTADRLELWMDMYALGDRIRTGRRTRDFRMKTDSNIYAIEIMLGDFLDVKPKMKTSNKLDDEQSSAANRVRAVAAKIDSGYSIKIRVPFQLLGFSRAPVDENELTEFGATVVVHDVDNPYRPEETTTISTSQNFETTKPATFGSLVLIPEANHYGESINIYMGDLKERLEEVGY